MWSRASHRDAEARDCVSKSVEIKSGTLGRQLGDFRKLDAFVGEFGKHSAEIAGSFALR